MCRRRAREGFSFVEIMIAVVVVAIGTLGIIATLIYGTKSSEHAQRMTEATAHARHLMGLVRSGGWAVNDWGNLDPNLDDADDVRRELNEPPFDGFDGMPLGTNMQRNIQITQGLAMDEMGDVARIRVRVFWFSDGNERSVELVGFQGQP